MAIDDNDISVEHEEPDECIILTESITPSYPGWYDIRHEN